MLPKHVYLIVPQFSGYRSTSERQRTRQTAFPTRPQLLTRSTIFPDAGQNFLVVSNAVPELQAKSLGRTGGSYAQKNRKKRVQVSLVA